MNNLDLFSLALGLQSPWILTSVKLEEGQNKQKELHISISHSRGSQFIDESGVMCGVHDTKERVWRHLNFFEHECIITTFFDGF